MTNGYDDREPLPNFSFLDATIFDDVGYSPDTGFAVGAGYKRSVSPYEPLPDLRTKDTGFLTGRGGANVAAGLQGLGSIGSAYSAYKQYQLGKDTLKQNRAAFNRNLGNQAQITNAEIADRALRRAAQRSDLAGDFNAIQSAADAVTERRKISGQPI